MISMNNFGKNGRLGNQLFQFSFLFGLSKIKGYHFCIPNNRSHYKQIEKYKNSSSFFDCFDIKHNCFRFTKLKPFREKYFHFNNNFVNYPDNVDYDGYFQSEKYFKHCKDELKSVLRFNKNHINSCDSSLDYNNIVSIHVRRGDYVNNPVHPTVDFTYLNQAKSNFVSKKFLVFSDDIDWCVQNNIGDFYAKNNSDCVDLYQMSLCSASIIANSSFSWWGAYLGRDKEKVIAPKKWFSGINSNCNVSDIYCESWTIL